MVPKIKNTLEEKKNCLTAKHNSNADKSVDFQWPNRKKMFSNLMEISEGNKKNILLDVDLNFLKKTNLKVWERC